VLLAAVLSLAALTACTAQEPPQPTGANTTTTPAQPKLLTWAKTASNSPTPDALVAGKLAVNDAGCVTIGSALLLAPPGSSALPDGSGISLAGHGEYRFGQSLQNLRGGYGDITGTATDPAGIAECRSQANPEQEYAVVADS
jgi:hypothetical protein